jgi:protein-S-isoprenylcysteine O-methyltransferase Ste14
MPLALLTYFLVFVAVAFVWPTWRLWRTARINALVLPFDDTAHGVVSKSFRLLVLGLLAVLLAALWAPAEQFGPLLWLDRPIARIAGGVLLAGSLALIVVAQAQMGRSWRIGIDTGRPTDLVQSGVFSRSRNPIFLSMRLTLLGVLLVWPNAATLAAFLIGEWSCRCRCGWRRITWRGCWAPNTRPTGRGLAGGSRGRTPQPHMEKAASGGKRPLLVELSGVEPLTS